MKIRRSVLKMPKLNRVLLISIPEEDIKKEFGWRYQRWGEDAVKTYLVNNSKLIDNGLALVGVGELCHHPPPLKQRIRISPDLIFRKGDIHYVVEVKTRRGSASTQLAQEVACFEYDMRQQNENYKEVIPVLAMVDDSIQEPKSFWAERDDPTAKWMKSYISELLKGK